MATPGVIDLAGLIKFEITLTDELNVFPSALSAFIFTSL
jgi:hypothetical protein